MFTQLSDSPNIGCGNADVNQENYRQSCILVQRLLNWDGLCPGQSIDTAASLACTLQNFFFHFSKVASALFSMYPYFCVEYNLIFVIFLAMKACRTWELDRAGLRQ